MWTQGTVTVRIEGKDIKVSYWIKNFEEPSEEYGIDGGRISKLMLKEGRHITCNYDRGWDVKPETKASKEAYKALLKGFN